MWIGRALGVGVAGGERADRKDARAGRHAEQLLMRHDRAGHAGAVRMRVVVDRRSRRTVGDGAGEIGMRAVDLGVDHADRDVVARDDAMGREQPQLLRHVLAGIALLRRRRLHLGLRQRVSIVGLRGGDDLVLGERADHGRNRLLAGVAHPEGGVAALREALRGEHGQIVLLENRLQRRLRDVARQLQHHLVADEAGFGRAAADRSSGSRRRRAGSDPARCCRSFAARPAPAAVVAAVAVVAAPRTA